jgi:hypothetical protein
LNNVILVVFMDGAAIQFYPTGTHI